MTSGAPLRLRFIGWSVFIFAMLAVFAFRVLPHAKVETNILALLPQVQTDRGLDAALDEFSAQLARQQIFLIGSDQLADAKLAAAAFAKELATSGAFSSVRWQIDSDLAQRVAVYVAHRAFLLSPTDEAALDAGETEAIAKRALRSAYTPAGLLQPLGLAEDPLGFTNDYLRATAGVAGNTRLEGNLLVAERDGREFVLVITENEGHPFAAATQERVIPAIARARLAASRATNAPVEIAGSGAIQHASAAAIRARNEVTTFGTIESIAVVLLLLLVFGSIRPLLLGVMTLGLAIVAAYTVVHLVFGEVHILALVFGSSLIGSVIDYSIHFLADRFRDPEHWTPASAVHHVSPAILLGLTTTLVGYLVLAVVPFPGLEQIAVFCIAGLIVGCGCVLCLYPILASARGRLPKFGPL
ncbi:MAG: MMPL family transporter, partial [Steroidobacteraceae bacterium]